jgi:hypothetical protein
VAIFFYIRDEFRINYYSDLELRKGPFLLAILLEIMISMSIIRMPHNNTSAQTYDTITKQRKIFKDNPQIPLGSGVGTIGHEPLAANPTTNQIYVTNT